MFHIEPVHQFQSNFHPVGCFNFILVVRRAIIKYSDGKSSIVVQWNARLQQAITYSQNAKALNAKSWQ